MVYPARNSFKFVHKSISKSFTELSFVFLAKKCGQKYFNNLLLFLTFQQQFIPFLIHFTKENGTSGGISVRSTRKLKSDKYNPYEKQIPTNRPDYYFILML